MNYVNVVARILLALIFIVAGFGKLQNIDGTAGYISSVGLPGALLVWPTIALELLGGLAIIVGFQTRIVAWVLAAFCVVSGFLFHFDFADQMQSIMFLKNLAMAGGFLLLAAGPVPPLSVDGRR